MCARETIHRRAVDRVRMATQHARIPRCPPSAYSLPAIRDREAIRSLIIHMPDRDAIQSLIIHMPDRDAVPSPIVHMPDRDAVPARIVQAAHVPNGVGQLGLDVVFSEASQNPACPAMFSHRAPTALPLRALERRPLRHLLRPQARVAFGNESVVVVRSNVRVPEAKQ